MFVLYAMQGKAMQEKTKKSKGRSVETMDVAAAAAALCVCEIYQVLPLWTFVALTKKNNIIECMCVRLMLVSLSNYHG